MSFKDLQQLASATAEITVGENTQIVQKLTIKEKEEYTRLVNQGLGTIRTDMGQSNNTQSANLNVERVTTAQDKANRYLIKASFKDEEIKDEDIDQLYDIYDELVEELKRVNHISEVDNSTLEADIKK